MRSVFVLSFTVFFIAFSQLMAEPWDVSAEASLTFSQSYYSDNWAGSELGNITWTANIFSTAEKQLSELLHNRTTLTLEYGQSHQEKIREDGTKHWGRPEKSSDKIDLESVLRFTLDVYVDPFIAGRWQSQFLDQRDAEETIIINPNRFTESAGLMRVFVEEENHYLSTRLGAAFRQTLDRNEMVREAEAIYDGGIEFIAQYMRRFLPQNILYKSRLQVYQALINSEEDELENDHWKRVDVNWENTFTTRIWSIVNAVLMIEMEYEREEHRNPQYRQTLGLGVSITLY